MDSDNEKDDDVQNKRKNKEQEKALIKPKAKTSQISASKIGRLVSVLVLYLIQTFSKGSLGLFAISEIHPNYVIVNYTRNVKGYLPMEGKEDKKLEVGQLIVALVLSDGTAQYNTANSGN